MGTLKKDCFALFAIFLFVFAIKAGLSFLMRGPFLFSDEACVIAKAVYFSEHFKMVPCASITLAGDGDPFPLYSILISPIYYFLSGMKAYYAVLILNSFIVSTLVFPLHSIFEIFLKSKLVMFSFVISILFLSEVFIFEKMLMTEVMFVVLNVWFLYFYLNSFFNNQKRNKIIALSLAILASLSRPFGFILPFAIAINEFFLSKNKKKSFPYLILALAMFVLATMVIWKNLLPEVYERLLTLNRENNLLLLLKAVKNQINSFTLASFIAPLLLFSIHVWEKDSEILKKIRCFLISFILLNFLVSVQHIYAYYLGGNDMDLMTRYINPSLIYIFIFSLIFLAKYKSFVLSSRNIVIIATILFPLFFFNIEGVKHSQNLDLAPYFDPVRLELGDDMRMTDFLDIVLWSYVLVLLGLLLTNRRKILSVIIVFIIFVHSAFAFRWMQNFVAEEKLVTYELFKDEDFSMLFLERPGEIIARFYFWNQISLSKNKSYVAKYQPGPEMNKTLSFPLAINDNLIIDMPDIIVTMHELDYPEIGPDYLEMNIYAPKLAKNITDD